MYYLMCICVQINHYSNTKSVPLARPLTTYFHCFLLTVTSCVMFKKDHISLRILLNICFYSFNPLYTPLNFQPIFLAQSFIFLQLRLKSSYSFFVFFTKRPSFHSVHCHLPKYVATLFLRCLFTDSQRNFLLLVNAFFAIEINILISSDQNI